MILRYIYKQPELAISSSYDMIELKWAAAGNSWTLKVQALILLLQRLAIIMLNLMRVISLFNHA